MTLLSCGRLERCFLVSFIVLVSGSCGLLLVSSRSLGNEEMDKLVLLDIKGYLAAGGGLSSWNESYHFCEWQGVVCGDGKLRERLISLELYNQGLAGSLPPSIGNLTFLTGIDLGSNKLVGNIPKELGLLYRLQNLNLSDNMLNGYIPVELMNCSGLQMLHLGSNHLTGSIPFEVGYLLKLSLLVLGSNNLSGTVPPSIGYLSELQELSLTKNSLTGTIPSYIGNLSSLELLSLGDNLIEGEIPSDFGKLQKLKIFHLSINRLSGTIPASLYNLSSAIEISLTKNYLHGDFMPNSEINMPCLVYLIFGENKFTGSITEALLNISTLEYFDAPSNNLTGQVPSNLGVLRNLQRFNVEFNELGSGKSGDLEFLANLSNAGDLSVLSLRSNKFGGEFPASFLNSSTKLTSLILGNNHISGRIPDGIGKQISLTIVGMENNDLEGVIPESLGNLTMLEKMHLHGNRLTGRIPDSLGNLTSLFFLSLADNDLEGNIPYSLKQCDRMENLYLNQNNLSGEIPEDFLNHFTRLVILNLAQNLLNGSIPSEIGHLKNLGVLALNDNKLSGQIPEELGECAGLELLDISENYLVGSIPSLSKLKALQILNVFDNELSGSIPTVLENLNVLGYLNLSSNDLEGQVPTRGVFENFSSLSLTGNIKLCGGIPQLHLPSCNKKQQITYPKIVIISTVICCVGFLAFMITCLVLYRKRRVKKDLSLASLEENVLLRASYKDLYDATSGFDPSNIIGVGSFGSVYKGLLSKEQIPVAVKVLNLQRHGASKTFQAECKSLGTIRHRNLLKILTTCTSIDYKGNEFMALVYKLMPNGSLENLLHGSMSLSFTQTLDIAIDIASALDYLHNGCEAPIAHCDLKPSNVLIDQNMVAHVGDFGLAKVLFIMSDEGQNEEHSNSYAVKGSIGYIAPEYGMGAMVSLQGDVYSFGILLLEMMTGLRPTNELFTDGTGIHEYVMRALPDHASKIVCPNFLTEIEGRVFQRSRRNDTDEKWKCIVSLLDIGVSCSMANPANRMGIRDALNALLVLKNNPHKVDVGFPNKENIYPPWST